MTAISIHEAEGQLSQLVAKACRGETIVLMDGDNQVTLSPRILDVETDNPELEAELLKVAGETSKPWQPEQFREIADRALQEYRARQQK